MDFPDPEPPLTGRVRVFAVVAAVAALGIYAAVLGHFVGAVAGSSDTSGYLNHARLLSWHYIHIPARTVPGLPMEGVATPLYIPLGFKPAWNGDGLVPTYPVGLPLFILAAKFVAGWHNAGDVVIVLHALAGLCATFVLGRSLGLSRAWAAAGALVIALSPLYLFMSMQAMSDVPSLVWTCLAMIAALKSRERPAWALAAGAAVAVDVLLRPTNILTFVPLALALGGSPRRWVLLGLGGLPGAVFYLGHSLRAYGHFLTTGYGDTTFAFSSGYVPGTLLHYVRWLPLLFTPLVVLAAGLPWRGGGKPRDRWMLAVWILTFASFYSTYVFTHQTWWYLRFLLPAAPAMVVGGLLVARDLLSRAPRWADPARSAGAATAAVALAAAVLLMGSRSLHPFIVGDEELRYGRLADWMERNMPHDSVCLAMQATGAIVYYTQFTFLRWDALHPDNLPKVEEALRSSHRPLYAVLFPFEVLDSLGLDTYIPGHWTQVGKVDNVTVWRRDPGPAKK